MDETTLKIAIASFMHDVGKFADKDTLGVTDQYIDDHAGLYLPFYNGRYSHYHAVYTAAFIEQTNEILPHEFNSPLWGEGDAFINLAAGHHKPETPMQWVIAIADRVSSGWDRDTFDREYNRQIAWKDYKKTRLLPLFEQLMTEQNHDSALRETLSYSYPLKEISPETIFPKPKKEVTPEANDDAEAQYRELFDKFTKGLKRLRHRKENLELWFDHFDSLMMLYTSSLPAARAGDVVPDVSLYDHSKVTAALAVAIYLYHKQNDSLTVESIQNYEDKKFLIINGDFYGIQDFIFSGYGDTRKYRSKLLRGRSFIVSIFSELAADMLSSEIGLPSSSIILNSAGKFTILAPNTKEAKKSIQYVEKNVNDWLISVSYGETTMGFSFLEATANDFVLGNFIEMWDQMGRIMEKKKYTRINMNHYGGAVVEYLDSFVNALAHPLCPICGKRPSSSDVEGTAYVGKAQSACKMCRDQIFLGTNLVKRDRLAVTSPDAEIKGEEDKLFEPIFGKYQLAFLEGGLKEMAVKGQLLKYWDLTINLEEEVSRDVTVKFINGYVPKYTDEDERDDRILAGEKSEAKKLELIEQNTPGDPKTLGHIACMARNPTEKEGQFCGIEALGVLKADVDHLGLLMACGLKPERSTLSRIATLSRQLHYYFAVYLPHLLITESRFKDIYTVFAGGDDLFLIGPWNRIIDLVILLKDTFSEYVCRNENIHFSAGISLHKPQTPLDAMGEASESVLEKSKSEERNRLTLFSETATWEQVEKLTQIKQKLLQWIDKGWINQAMLYRLNSFMEMAGEEKKVIMDHEIFIDDMGCTKWRSMMAYTAERNVAKKIKGEERKNAVNEVVAMLTQWLTEYGGQLKIPLWDILYNRR